MARYWCTRCGEESNTLSPEHLCKDVESRLTEYHNRRRSYLLRLIRGVRCPKHGTVFQVVCGQKVCGTCWIEQPFRKPPKSDGPVEFKPAKFAGYGRNMK